LEINSPGKHLKEEVDPEVLLADFFEDITVRVGEEGLSLLFSQSFELGPRFVCFRVFLLHIRWSLGTSRSVHLEVCADFNRFAGLRLMLETAG